MTTADADQALLNKINDAVAAANEAEKTVTTAQADLVSRSKAVGLLLLEAKKRHPKVADFEAFLKRVNGLKRSRAYDCMRIAGGRVTDEELRQETRDRVKKHREKKKLPTPQPALPEPSPPSVTVTESPEIGQEQRTAENALPDDSAEEYLTPEEKKSAHYLNEFKIACRTYLPKLTEYDQIEAIQFVHDTLKAAAKKAKAA